VLAGTAEFMKFWAEAHVDKVHAAIKKGANLVVMGVSSSGSLLRAVKRSVRLEKYRLRANPSSLFCGENFLIHGQTIDRSRKRPCRKSRENP
jgi:hypothetical protein